MKLTHVRLLVSQFAECFRFYRDVLELEYRAGDESGPYVEFLTGDAYIALFQKEYMAHVVKRADKPPFADAQDVVVLTLEVDNVDEWATKLVAKGVVLINEPMDMPDWVIRVAHFRDPDGNLIEINQPLNN